MNMAEIIIYWKVLCGKCFLKVFLKSFREIGEYNLDSTASSQASYYREYFKRYIKSAKSVAFYLYCSGDK